MKKVSDPLKFTLAILLLLFTCTVIVIGLRSSSSVQSELVGICPGRQYKGTTSENLDFMYKSLEQRVKLDSDSEEIAFVFFVDDLLGIDEFIDLFSEYNLAIPDPEIERSGSIHIWYDIKNPVEFSAGVSNTALVEDHLVVEDFGSWAIDHFNDDNVDMGSMHIRAFAAKGRAEDLLNLWDENERVRGVAIGCTRPQYIVGPHDPVFFGSGSNLISE